jgi:hypothetical protein
MTILLNGSDLAPHFAFFFHLPNGSDVGFWLYAGSDTPEPPVVYVGSEGEFTVVGATLEEFLSKIAYGQIRIPDLKLDGGVANGASLLQWLAPRRVLRQSPEVIAHYPDFKQWMMGWGRNQRDLIRKNPINSKIAELLRKYVAPDAMRWERANFDVLCVGSCFNVWRRYRGVIAMPQHEMHDLEPLFRELREERARGYADRGRWFSSWVSVGKEAAAYMSCNFMKRPTFLDVDPQVPIKEYQEDLRAFPRSKYWLPKWLAQKA